MRLVVLATLMIGCGESAPAPLVPGEDRLVFVDEADVDTDLPVATSEPVAEVVPPVEAAAPDAEPAESSPSAPPVPRPTASTTSEPRPVAAPADASPEPEPDAAPAVVEVAVDEPEAPPARGATRYSLTPSNSWLYVMIRYDRNAWVAGHDHGARAMTFDGEVTWNPQDVSDCKVSISFPVDALRIDPPGLRARLGLEGETDAKDIGKIESNMLGKQQLDRSRFPRISYTAVKCEQAGKQVKVTGDLAIHGVGKRMAAILDVTEDGTTFHAKGGFRANHSDFAMDPFTAALGALKNDPTLTFFLDVRGRVTPSD